MTKQERIIPKRIEDFLDHHEQIGFHFMSYNSGDRQVELEHLIGILRNGIVSPLNATKIEKRAGKKIFDIDPTRGKDQKGEFFGPEVYYRGFQQHKSKFNPFSFIGTVYEKVILKAHSTSFEKLPGLLFVRPGLEYKITDNTKHFLTTNNRIQSRYILAVVLPALGKNQIQKWIENIKEFEKPIYDHDGKLIWKPNGKKE